MKDYIIISDATADLSPQLIEELKVDIIPMEFAVSEDTRLYYPDFREMPIKDFYSRVRAGEETSTAQIKLVDFERIFRSYLEQGKDILYIAFSSGLSGTYNTSLLVKDHLLAEFPDAKICCVDSLSASMGEGLLVYYAAQQKEAGLSVEELAAYLEVQKYRICHWFNVDDLYHLKRGGRCSAMAAFAGSLLNIKPILKFDEYGHMIPIYKVRTCKKILDTMVQEIENTAIDISSQTVYISHADNYEMANKLAEMIKEKFQPPRIEISYIGPVIGSHVGGGTIALFFVAEHR